MKTMKLVKLLFLAGLAIIVESAGIYGEEAGKSATNERSDDQLIAEVAELTKNVQQRYSFTRDSTKLVPFPDPALRWSNPTAGRVFGNVCVWTEDGRPAMVACIYRFFSPNWGATLELTSLSETKLTGQIGNNPFWTPQTGLKREPLLVDEHPANSPAARLVQMRRMAGEFAAQLEDTRGTNKQVARELRLLTKPVFRYPTTDSTSTRASYVDGALFAFVEGTDPEVLLILEAIGSNESLRWVYGLARMNRDAIRVTFRGQPVWSVPYLANQLNQKGEAYTLFSLDQGPLGQR